MSFDLGPQKMPATTRQIQAQVNWHNRELRSTMIEQLRALLAEIPAANIPEDFGPHSYSGGNLDDAYSLGFDHGERLLADRIRKLLGDE